MQIIAKLKYGLGNKLFKLIHAIYLSKLLNQKLLLIIVQSPHENNDAYPLKKFYDHKFYNQETIDKKLPEFESMITDLYKRKEILNIEDKSPDYILKKYDSLSQFKYAIMWGFFIKTTYIPNFKQFIFDNLIIPDVDYCFEYDKYNYIGIHIRTGDFVNQNINNKNSIYKILKPSYYQKLIEQIINDRNTSPEASRASNKKTKILFFTNDTYNFIENYVLKGINIDYEIVNKNATDELVIFSKCNDLILSISTFSYWAAYFNKGGNIYYPDGLSSTNDNAVLNLYDDKYSNWIPCNTSNHIMSRNEIIKIFKTKYVK